MTANVLPAVMAVAEALQLREGDAIPPQGSAIPKLDPRQDECSEESDALLVSPEEPATDRDLWLYRDRTMGILRRYLRMAIEVGRLPSLLGREFFRTRITSYHSQTFEDSVIFVHDVEACLELLEEGDKALIAMIVLQQHTQEETARLLHCTLRTITRHFPEALDRTTEIFLNREILMPLRAHVPISREACQGVKDHEFPTSGSG